MQISLETSPGLSLPGSRVITTHSSQPQGSSFCPRVPPPCFNDQLFAPKTSSGIRSWPWLWNPSLQNLITRLPQHQAHGAVVSLDPTLFEGARLSPLTCVSGPALCWYTVGAQYVGKCECTPHAFALLCFSLFPPHPTPQGPSGTLPLRGFCCVNRVSYG